MHQVFADMDITGSSAIIETVVPAAINLDLLAVLSGIPEITDWMSAGDAALTNPADVKTLAWKDRVSQIVATPTQSGFVPAIVTLDGKTAIKFVGAGMQMNGRTFEGLTEWTRTLVLRPPTLSGEQGIIGSSTGTGPKISAYHNPPGQVTVSNNTGSASVSTAGAILPANLTALLTVSWSKALGQVRVKRNGKLVATIAHTTDPGAGTPILGALYSNVNNGFFGHIMESLAFAGADMLATADRLDSLAYLETKLMADYGIVAA